MGNSATTRRARQPRANPATPETGHIDCVLPAGSLKPKLQTFDSFMGAVLAPVELDARPPFRDHLCTLMQRDFNDIPEMLLRDLAISVRKLADLCREHGWEL